MLAVGLGKQRGAETLHGAGLAQAIPDVARVLLGTGKVVGGLAVVENAADDPYRIEAVPPEAFHATDEALLRLSNSLLPRIPFDHLDVLVVDWIGKNLSGSGMDPNVIGMWRRLGGAPAGLPAHRGAGRDPGVARQRHRDRLGGLHHPAPGGLDRLRGDVHELPHGERPGRGPHPHDHGHRPRGAEAAAKTSGAAGPLRIVRVHSTLRLEESVRLPGPPARGGGQPGLEVLAPPAPLLLDDAGHLGPAFLIK